MTTRASPAAVMAILMLGGACASPRERGGDGAAAAPGVPDAGTDQKPPAQLPSDPPAVDASGDSGGAAVPGSDAPVAPDVAVVPPAADSGAAPYDAPLGPGLARIAWERWVGQGYGLALTSDAIYLAGSFSVEQDFGGTMVTSKGAEDIYFARYDLEGKLAWVRTAGGAMWDEGTAVTIAGNGQVVVSGRFRSDRIDLGGMPLASSNGQAFFLAWLSQAGDVQRVQLDVGGHALATDRAGNVLAAGYSSAPALTKFDPSGNRVWEFRPPDDLFPQAVASDGTGNVYLAGIFHGSITIANRTHTSLGDRDGFLIKLAPGGNVLWSTSLGGDREQECPALAVGADGDAYLACQFRGELLVDGQRHRAQGEGYDLVLARFDRASGNRRWLRSFGGMDPDYGQALVAAGDDLLLAAALTGPVDLGTGMINPGQAILRFNPATGVHRAHAFLSEGVPRVLGLHASGDYFGVAARLARLTLRWP